MQPSYHPLQLFYLTLQIFSTALPKVVANYETLFIPFDSFTWFGFVISTVVELVLLLLLDCLWRLTSRGRDAKKDYVYDGR
jgi:hypothetical protein